MDHLIEENNCLVILEEEAEVLTVHNVNEWLSSLRLVPTSSNTVEVDISEEGFKEFDRYKVEYTTIDQPDQWQQVRSDFPPRRSFLLFGFRCRISPMMCLI